MSAFNGWALAGFVAAFATSGDIVVGIGGGLLGILALGVVELMRGTDVL